MKKEFLGLLATALFLITCKSQTTENEIATVTDIHPDKVVLSDGNIIQTPPMAVNEETTLYIVRHGEKTNAADPQKEFTAELNSNGQQRAAKLETLFKKTILGAVLAIPSRYAMQTGELVAKQQRVELYNYNFTDYGALLDYIYKEEKGKKYLVVGRAESIPDLLNLLTAGQKFPAIPEGVYDDMFVVVTKQRGDAKVWHVKY